MDWSVLLGERDTCMDFTYRFLFDSPAFFDTLAWLEFVFVSLVLYSSTLTLEPCALITICISPILCYVSEAWLQRYPLA